MDLLKKASNEYHKGQLPTSDCFFYIHPLIIDQPTEYRRQLVGALVSAKTPVARKAPRRSTEASPQST